MSSLDFMRDDDLLNQNKTSTQPIAPQPAVSAKPLKADAIENSWQNIPRTISGGAKDILKQSFPDTNQAYQESKTMNPIAKATAIGKGTVSALKEGLVQPLNRLGVGLARNLAGGGTEKAFTPKPGYQQQLLGHEEVKPLSQDLGDTVAMGHDLARKYNPGGDDPNAWSSKVFAGSMTPVFALLAGGMKAMDADVGAGDLIEKPLKQGLEHLVQEGGEKIAKKTFQGLDEVTLKTVEKMKGKADVSKQFIADLAKAPDLKQQEREILNEVLSRYSDKGKVNVEQFAKEVEQELLPLSAKDVPTRYESINLPEDLRGNVDQYQEMVYESPIKTQAGNVHFANHTENYFGHVRTEDLPTGYAARPPGYNNEETKKTLDWMYDRRKQYEAKDDPQFPQLPQLNKQIAGLEEWINQPPGGTRRVLEVQSDLMQRGRMENESKQFLIPTDYLTSNEREAFGASARRLSLLEGAENKGAYLDEIKQLEEKMSELTNKGTLMKDAEAAKRAPEIAKLSQYNNPTAHFRMIREEVKRAALDGKDKIQFPTGKTAAQIEGFIGGDAMVPDTAAIGDSFDYGGEPHIVLDKDPYDRSATVTRADNIHDQFPVSDILGEEKFSIMQDISSGDADEHDLNAALKEVHDDIVHHRSVDMPTDLKDRLVKLYESTDTGDVVEALKGTDEDVKNMLSSYVVGNRMDVSGKRVHYVTDINAEKMLSPGDIRNIHGYLDESMPGLFYADEETGMFYKLKNEGETESMSIGTTSEDFNIDDLPTEQKAVVSFYEKEVQKYLKSKYPGMQRVTDENGVEWFEVPIKPEQGKMPVEAFAAAPLAPVLATTNKKDKQNQ